MYQRSKIAKHYFRAIAVLAVSLMGSPLVPAHPGSSNPE
jgi:hypothetical protein